MANEIVFTNKEKAFISISASIAAGCQPCTEYHVNGARQAGACDRSIALAAETALTVRESATRNMGSWADHCAGPRPECELVVTPDQLDTSPFLLNFQNGTIDLETGVIRLNHNRLNAIARHTVLCDPDDPQRNPANPRRSGWADDADSRPLFERLQAIAAIARPHLEGFEEPLEHELREVTHEA